MNKKIIIICVLIGFCVSCDREMPPIAPNTTQVDSTKNSELVGFYVLNEGNMGSNKCSLDFFDFESGEYKTNIFPSINPDVVKELGDVGNDLKIYGNRLYAVINCSNLVEVMEAQTAKHIGWIDIPNCRYITFANGKGYISSYAGPQGIDPNARSGYIAEFDTATLQITREVVVGYQPEEMTIIGKKMYVANSGGYRIPNYDTRVFIVDLESFTTIKTLNVAQNLHRVRQDSNGKIYVSSRGDYNGKGANIYVIDSATDEICDSLGFAATNFCISGDSIFAVHARRDLLDSKVFYTLYDIKSRKIMSDNFITDGNEKNIEVPYGIAVNPTTKEFIVTDATSYVMPGALYYFNADGTLKWQVTTGDIPAHIAFLHKSN